MVGLVPSPSNCIAHLSYCANSPWPEGVLVLKACLWSREARFTLQKLGHCFILYIRQYIGYPRRPLLQHSMESMNLKDRFTMLKKCRSTLDCLTYEMSYIRHLQPIVSTQSEQKLCVKQHIFFIVTCFATVSILLLHTHNIVDPFMMQTLR